MPHRPKPRGYDALDIYLATQDSAKAALKVRKWTDKQQTYIENFTDFASINRAVDRLGRTRFRNKASGRFVKGY